MNAEKLLELYDSVADAPDAIHRLRRFVLDLAVRGKLVAQDPADEPASELFKTIASERNARVKSGQIRKGKQNDLVEAAPWGAPLGWVWLPLGDTGNIFSGNSIDAVTRERLEKTNAGRPFIATKDVGYGLDPIAYDNGLLVSASDESFKIARAQSVLICAEGGSAGRKIGISDQEICFGNKLLANETWSVVLPRYTLFFYQSPSFYEQFARQMSGIIGGISINKFLQLPFPLPPLAEQHRIVAKVDELMSLLDGLEQARAGREVLRDQLTAATLHRLTESNPDDFHPAAHFALQTLPHLTTRPDQIKTLRQTILNLAVRGKLVEQDPADEPAAELLKRTATGRKGLVLGPDMTLVDFTVPTNWQWTSLDRLIVEGPQNGLSPRPTNNLEAPKAITLTATTSGKFNPTFYKHVDVTHAELDRFWLVPGDLLFQRGNTPEYVGMAAVYDGPERTYLFPDLIIRVRACSSVMVSFLHLWCISPVCRSYLTKNATGAQKTMPKINQDVLKVMPIPLPPLAAQHRIVARVDALMALCDQLEAGLISTETTRSRLLDAILHSALSEELAA